MWSWSSRLHRRPRSPGRWHEAWTRTTFVRGSTRSSRWTRGPALRTSCWTTKAHARSSSPRSRCSGGISPREPPAAGSIPAMPLRAVLFDVGETLVHPAPSFPELFSTVVAAEGHTRSPDAVIDASRAVFHRFSEAARDVELWTTSPERSARFWKSVYERMLI